MSRYGKSRKILLVSFRKDPDVPLSSRDNLGQNCGGTRQCAQASEFKIKKARLIERAFFNNSKVISQKLIVFRLKELLLDAGYSLF